MADKMWSKIKDKLMPNVFKAAEGDAEMRALVLVHGRAEMSDEVRMPSLSSTQVLVRVHCYGLSRADRAQAALLGSVLGKKRADELDGIMRRQGAPFGVNVCGTVVQLGWKGGDRVHMFPIAIGDEVYGFTEGSSSEFVVCEASKVALKPDSLSDEMAATLPVAGLTALQSLKFNKFGDGQAIMILGAQDATGSLFAQLALELGASRIIAVCEPEFEPYCSTIAGEVYDFDSFDQHIPEMDLIVDVVTSHLEEKDATLFARCRETMKPGAHFVAANAGLVDVLRKRATKKLGFDVQRSGFDAADFTPNSDDLIRVVESLLPGFSIPIVEIPFESEAILDAYAQLHESPRATRPVIVRIWHPSKDLHEVVDRRHTVKRN